MTHLQQEPHEPEAEDTAADCGDECVRHLVDCYITGRHCTRTRPGPESSQRTHRHPAWSTPESQANDHTVIPPEARRSEAAFPKTFVGQLEAEEDFRKVLPSEPPSCGIANGRTSGGPESSERSHRHPTRSTARRGSLTGDLSMAARGKDEFLRDFIDMCSTEHGKARIRISQHPRHRPIGSTWERSSSV